MKSSRRDRSSTPASPNLPKSWRFLLPFLGLLLAIPLPAWLWWSMVNGSVGQGRTGNTSALATAPTQAPGDSAPPLPVSSAVPLQCPANFAFATKAVQTDSLPEQNSQPQSDTGNPQPPGLSTPLVKRLPQFATWLEQPQPIAAAIAANLGPVLAAQFSPQPFPDISQRARQARVPIMMYHDILPEKQVFFDVTPAEFEADLQLIRDQGLTPINLDQLVTHLTTGLPLPAKPILLSFDDGYAGHYEYVYPLLKKYGYPGVFAIYPDKVGTKKGRSSLTWEQLRQMAADPLVTIASHSVSHAVLTQVDEAQLEKEAVESKRILEQELGIPINHFVYPEGKYNERVQDWVKQAGYHSALTMDDLENRFAGQSKDLLSIDRIGQSQLETIIEQAYGGPPLPGWNNSFNFSAPIEVNRPTINEVPLILISGGRPITIHADSRYQVPEILAQTQAVAGVDGGFFSLEFLDSNVMIGPVLSQKNGQFVPGNASENPRLNSRPLVLISPSGVRFIPFDASKHNSLEGIQAEDPGATDAFVAAAWLVKQNQPQPEQSFGNLFDFNAARHRAFWGINQNGQPTIGVSTEPVGSVELGEILYQAGFRDAVMLDSGASTSLAYQGESLVGYTPRPVPHVVALVPAEVPQGCIFQAQK